MFTVRSLLVNVDPLQLTILSLSTHSVLFTAFKFYVRPQTLLHLPKVDLFIVQLEVRVPALRQDCWTLENFSVNCP